MKKGYHPYLRNVPSEPSAKALAHDQDEYDSSDDEAVNTVYLGTKQSKLYQMYLEEKKQKEILAKFIEQLMKSRYKK